MELLMLGTGHAMVTRCYNTCFLLSGNGERLLVDAGGGNGFSSSLKRRASPWTKSIPFM